MLTQPIQFFEPECIMRILISAICGLLIGMERERRAKSAGIRTHILVAISSCLMMVVSKYGFFDVVGFAGVSVDASRIAAGVVTAIGFLGAGVIFNRKEYTIGLTTSAGLWATVGMGIAVGAGLYVTGIAFTALMLIIQCILHSRLLNRTSVLSAELEMRIIEENLTIRDIGQAFRNAGLSIRNPQLRMENGNGIDFSCRLMITSRTDLGALTRQLENMGFSSEISRLVISH